MIRSDYAPYFQELKSRMTEVGYINVTQSELSAEFFLYSGWVVEFECERYYGPMFEIFIIPPKQIQTRSRKYGLSLLMLAFKKLTGKDYGKPTIENQVNFLIEEKERVFSDPTFYEAEYAKLNNITS